MSIRVQWRRGTAAEWASANPTLANGEAGFENDTGKFKIGDGATAWSDLEYTGSAADVAAAQAAAQSASDSADAAAKSATAAATSVSTLAVQAETYGALGDGVNDDSDALLAAIATGKNISLRAGKTYLVSKPLVLAANQCLNGNGATIKRVAQATTTTTTTITSGSTNSITVADASAFRVGQRIALYNGSNYSTQAPKITNIAGNVITTDASHALSAGSPWSGTTTAALAFETLTLGEGSIVDGVTIDGNKGNWTKYRWETSAEIGVAGHYATARDVILKNCPSDAVIEHSAGPGGLLGVRYDNVRVVEANGNGIHFSGSTGSICRGFYGKNLNLDTAVGHADGGIILSNGVADLIIDGFYVENAISGVGSFDSTDNGDLTIINGVIRDCDTAMEGIFPSGEGAANVIIDNIRAYNSGMLRINQTSGGSAVFPTNWQLSNIYLDDTGLEITRARNITLTNFNVNAPAIPAPVAINDSKDITYVSGVVTGGASSIFVGGTNSERVKICAGVTVKGATSRGIHFDVGVGDDCVADGATIYMDATADASCYGIQQQEGTLAQGCVIRMDHGVGILQSTNNCLTIGNTIRQAAGTSIQNFGGSSGNVAINNFISAPVSNGGGASNTFTGNVTIPA